MTQHNDRNDIPEDQRITLSQASRHAPGRPNTSTMWRWCRRGVLARDGSRVYLKHQRFGSRVFTTLAWLNEFGEALAAADASYFSQLHHSESTSPLRPPGATARRRNPERTAPSNEQELHIATDLAALEAELEAEGL